MCIIQNLITMNSLIDNFRYTRRYRAEVSSGIGNFMNCLDILTKLSVITNCLIIFFTSTTFREIFTRGSHRSYTDWTVTKFLIIIVITEHVLMLVQMGINIFIDDKPEFVKVGERERNIICNTY